MTEQDKSLSAFPVTSDHYADKYCDPGMTLRDYFAAKAMPGLMSRNWSDFKGTDDELIQVWATSSYAIADALLAARQEQPK